jgi:hypothetical protein
MKKSRPKMKKIPPDYSPAPYQASVERAKKGQWLINARANSGGLEPA